MNKLTDDLIREKMFGDVNTANFYTLYRKNGKNAVELVVQVEQILAESGLTVSEIKGLLEYLSIVIDFSSYPRETK